ncbi:hypothetical protein BHM03_00043938 [Ensete ventricosum]|nr:hypothetical protein BHM03_00043938 [Ensete ventricosum]
MRPLRSSFDSSSLLFAAESWLSFGASQLEIRSWRWLSSRFGCSRMGNCWGAKVKAESPSHDVFASGTKASIFSDLLEDTVFGCLGGDSKHGSRKGNVLSSSSSRVSASSVPPTPRSEGEILTSSNLKSFTFNELRTATRNFRPDSVLGEGGFGSVFKGWIDEHTLAATKPGTGMVIAVKKLNQEGFQGHKEWLVSIDSCKIFALFVL